MSQYRNLLWLLVSVALATTVVQGQETFGKITGIVRDETGAVVPGVSITVTNQATNVSKKALSGDHGNYEVTHLNPGTYRVSAELPGFKRFVHEDVEVEALSTVRINIRLEIGELATELVVESGTPVVITDTAVVDETRHFDQIRDLPVNIKGATLYQWLYLTPTGNQGLGSQRALGGGRTSMTYFKVDGLSAQSTAFANQQGEFNPPEESIQEFRFEYVGAKAEFAELGNLTVITKSGGNQFHGSGYWYNAHSALSARNFFATTRDPIDPQTGERISTQVNEVGGSLGGPILKDKLFFFISHDFRRDSSARILTPSVPTLKMRQGDFSELLGLAKPILIKNPFTGEPFPGNVIPQEMLNPGAVTWSNRFYPAPNFGPPESFDKNFRTSLGIDQDVHYLVGRVDFNVSDNHSIYGRWSYNNDDSTRPGNLPPELVGSKVAVDTSPMILISDTYTFSPTVTNEFKIGYARSLDNKREQTLAGQELVDLLGIQGLPRQPGQDNIPKINVTGFTSVEQGGAWQLEETYHVSNAVSWIKGRHTLKAGIEWIPQQFDSEQFPDFGAYNFTPAFTGFSWADFLLGLPLTTSRATIRDKEYARFFHLGWYLQDDFKVTPRLTLNYGIRWDYSDPVVDRFDVLSSLDLATGSVVVPTAEVIQKVPPQWPEGIPIVTADQAGLPGRALREVDKNNFAPRLGFAFRPFEHGRFVIRGGYGIYYDLLTRNVSGGMFTTGPFRLSESFTNKFQGGEPLLTMEEPFLEKGTLGTLDLNFVSPGLVNSYAQQWNLTLEQDIGFNTGLRLSYIGTKSTQIPFRRNINQPPPSLEPFSKDRRPFPAFRNIIMTGSGGNQIYNAFSVNVERKIQGGLSFQTNWTWAKNITDTAQGFTVEAGDTIQNQFCRACERGNEQWTPRHRVIANLIWELPVGAGKRFLNQPGPLDHILGGWTISTVFIGQTGNFLTPSFSGSDPSNTNTFGGRPDRIADGNLPSGKTIDRWFDASAFAVPPKGRFGNTGRGILEGPGRTALNFGLFKRIRLGEESWVRVQATATNVLNHPNFSDPRLNISAPGSVGRITGQFGGRDFAGPREIELGLRFEF